MDHTRANQEAYDAIAKVYDAEFLQYPWYLAEHAKGMRLIRKYVPPVRPEKAIGAVDLGCGTGEYVIRLLSLGYHVVACDTSPAMIQVATEKGATYGSRLTPVVGDVLEIQAPRQRFSVAVSFGSVINHLEDWKAFFQKANSILLPGGLLLFSMDNVFGIDYVFYTLYSYLSRKPDRPAASELLNSAKSVVRAEQCVNEWPMQGASKRVRVHLTYWPMRSVKKMLKSSGFRIVQLDGVNILSCLLPRVVLSATYPQAQNRDGGFLLRTTSGIDDRVGRLLNRIAGIQFVVARKAP